MKIAYGFNLTKMYEIEGIGIAPFTVETVEFSSIDLKSALEIIKFRNPYQKKDTKRAKPDKFMVFIESN